MFAVCEQKWSQSDKRRFIYLFIYFCFGVCEGNLGSGLGGRGGGRKAAACGGAGDGYKNCKQPRQKKTCGVSLSRWSRSWFDILIEFCWSAAVEVSMGPSQSPAIVFSDDSLSVAGDFSTSSEGCDLKLVLEKRQNVIEKNLQSDRNFRKGVNALQERPGCPPLGLIFL